MKKKGFILPLLLGIAFSSITLVSCGNEAAQTQTLDSIEVFNPITNYEYMSEFVKPTVNAFYTNGSKSNVTNKCTFQGFDSTISGDETITVTYVESGITKSTTYTVTIAPRRKMLSEITVDLTTTKVSYEFNEQFVKPTVIASYDDETTADVSDKAISTGYIPAQSGMQVIDVSYTEQGIKKETNYIVTVADCPVILQSIDVQNPKTTYFIGEDFVKPSVIATFSNDTTLEVKDYCTFVGYSKETLGTQTITVAYTFNGVTETDSYTITVSEVVIKTLSKIEVKNPKTVYVLNEPFVKPDVMAYFTDGTSQNVKDNALFNGFDSSTLGEKEVTVSYTYIDKTETDSYSILIKNEVEKNLSKIDVENPQTQYYVDDTLVKPNVIATYDDLTTENVKDSAIFTGFDSSTVGDKTITVSYTYKEVTKSTTYTINVASKESKALSFAIFSDVQLTGETAIPNESVVNVGETYNAPYALKNHLLYCRENNIDVILMNGDVVNQANEYYYEYFEKIFESVYGDDESTYPELLWNMGNHEWWWGITENDPRQGTTVDPDKDAVALFKEYARIESDNLVAQSSVKYASNVETTLPTYYKVIKGVPFLTISGYDSTGNIPQELYNEIDAWMEDIEKLPSVQAGGPIFVQYHYPLTTTFTHGQNAGKYAEKLEQLLENNPNAVVFSGDTHYTGVNDRAINQVDFTTINLGTSSYSRAVAQSAVICDNYYNLKKSTSGKQAEIMVGNAKFKNAYTPTIEYVQVDNSKNSYTIDRYFSEAGGNVTKVGERWSIDPITSKNDFTYTNDRFQNTASAIELYGKEGVSWADDDKVIFGVDEEGKATVKFMDPLDYHFTEHFVIEVNDESYDVMSNYYKYQKNRESNYYILEDVPEADNYSVKVTAYDFFDNPSLNVLESNINDTSVCIEGYDDKASTVYSDISVRAEFDDVNGEDSSSALEYYVRGTTDNKAGAILHSPYDANKPESGMNEFLTLDDTPNIQPVLTVDVKNKLEEDLIFGLTVIDGSGEWLSDFGKESQQTVSGNNWTTLTWNLRELYNISSKGNIQRIGLKAKSASANSEGLYEMSFLLDNIDIIMEEAPSRGYRFEQATDLSFNFASIPLTETVTVDVKFDHPGQGKHINFMLGDGWDEYFGYYQVNDNGTLAQQYDGVSIDPLEDGYVRVTLVLSELTKAQGGTAPSTEINMLYVRGGWSDANGGYIDFNYKGGEVVRGEVFNETSNNTINLSKDYALTDTLVFDVKFDEGQVDKKICFSLVNTDSASWSEYFGYYSIFESGIPEKSYDGIKIQSTDDGYYRITCDLSTMAPLPGYGQQPSKVTAVYVRKGWTTASGLIDVEPSKGSIVRGVPLKTATDFTLDLDPAYTIATDTITFDVKFTSAADTYINVMLGEGWSNYFGYYKIFANGTLADTYNGVSIEAVGDGYYRVTFTLSQLTKVSGNPQTSIDLFYIRGTQSTASGYIDFTPSI